MAASDYTFQINGIVSTDKTVLQNLDILTGACATWLTYDTTAGQWAVVINQAGTSQASFTDSNIIGAITVSGSGIDRLYNSVRVEFPHVDLNDNRDFILDTIPAGDWYPNEIANTLNMAFDCINDPVQAEYVGLIELKQGRLDQVIRFQTDFSRLGLTAGDLIDITSGMYGFTNKVFRILSLKETDTDSGAIMLDITAQEYSAAVYSTADLARYTRTNSTGIVTMGAIGVPGTPEVNKTEYNSRPRVTISSTVPTGHVEALEFWYTPDTYIYDTNRVYALLDTIRPAAGNTLTYGNTITVTNDALPSGNLYVKTRGVNGQTTGPFSTPAGFVYTPVQVADSINENTTVTSGGSIATSLGALALLSAVNGLFSGNTATGGLFNKVFDLFKSNTGVDLVKQATTGGASVTNITFGSNATAAGWHVTKTGSTYVLELGGTAGVGITQTWDFGDSADPYQYSSTSNNITVDLLTIAVTYCGMSLVLDESAMATGYNHETSVARVFYDSSLVQYFELTPVNAYGGYNASDLYAGALDLSDWATPAPLTLQVWAAGDDPDVDTPILNQQYGSITFTS